MSTTKRKSSSGKKRTTSRATSRSRNTSSSRSKRAAAQQRQAAANQQSMYLVMGIVIGLLILLIGWLGVKFVNQGDEAESTTETVSSSTSTPTVDLDTLSAVAVDSGDDTADESEALESDDTDTKDTDDEDADDTESEDNDSDEDDTDLDTDEDTESEDSDSESDDESGEKITLYFPTDSSSCGTVTSVEREMELGDDTYGEILMAAMRGPNSDEDGFVDGVPSSVGLRLVQYTNDGAVITVTEGFDDLDSCAQETVEASLIETANAMFDLPEGTSGTVTTEDPNQEVVDQLFGDTADSDDDTSTDESTTGSTSNDTE